jgi:hypothetical protein
VVAVAGEFAGTGGVFVWAKEGNPTARLKARKTAMDLCMVGGPIFVVWKSEIKLLAGSR